MKTVLLEIINGPQANQKICIRLGVAIKLGSGRLADLSVNSDPALAPVHASIGHRRAGCFIECIEPDGQVLINGKSMQRSRLHHGDIIIAGNTQFKVSVISEDAVEPSAVEPAKPTPEVITEKPANAQVVPKPMANSPQAEITNHATVEMISKTLDRPYQVERLSEGLWRLVPLSEVEFPMDDAIRMLAEKFNCYLCIDDRILSEQNGMESEIENRFELGESLSLIQIPAESTIRLLESDDVRQVTTAIFSGESFETISQSVSRQSFSFRLPSIFATQMEVATPGIAAATMSQIACVLVSDRSNFWKVFTTLSVSESWQDIGLPNQPSASESS